MTVIIEPSDQLVVESELESKDQLPKEAIKSKVIGQEVSPTLDKEKLTQLVREAQMHNEHSQFLMFQLDNDVYALDILKVREILDTPPITKVPRVPAYLLGVINLRGSVVPVVDLKMRLGFEKKETEENEACVIIVEKEGRNNLLRPFGLLVDAVQEVIALASENISEVTKVGLGMNTDYVSGVGNHHDQFVLIMNLNKILAIEEEVNEDIADG